MTYYLGKRNENRLSITITKGLSALLWIAEQKGMFSDLGLKVSFKIVPYARKSLDLLVDGEVDCAALVETNVAYLGYLKPKIPVKCFAAIESRTGDNILLRSRAAGSARPQDLSGCRIGFMPRTTSHSFLNRFLDFYRIAKKDIVLRPVSPQLMGDVMANGEVDAVSCWMGYTFHTMSRLDRQGIPYTRFKNDGLFKSEVVLAAQKPCLVKKRKQIESLLKSLDAAKQYLSGHKQELVPVLGNRWNIPEEYRHEIWEQFHPGLAPIGPDYMQKIQEMGDWIRDKDTEFVGQNRPDYDDVVDNTIFLDLFPPQSV